MDQKQPATGGKIVMPDPRSLLLALYYYTSYPYRRWSNLRASPEHRAAAVVLFYHRIADDRATPWTTSNRNFARQIRWLARHFEIVPLEEAQRRIRNGDHPRPCVSITFDDGYAENCHHAIPLLLREKIPCTYFVTLENVLRAEPFAHDVALGNRFPPNSLDQLRAMAAHGVEIGAHTRTHPDLGQISDEDMLHREVVGPKDELQNLLDRPVRYFAFPFGQYMNLSSRAFQIAAGAGYEAVCSAYGGYNFPGDDPFHLQRIHVDDDLIRLKNRATVDPRKIGTPRFLYEPADADRPQNDAGAASQTQLQVPHHG
jgi:peptidoglycan/xylan/chitin deacetylase (PgdA/CDA1 family)